MTIRRRHGFWVQVISLFRSCWAVLGCLSCILDVCLIYLLKFYSKSAETQHRWWLYSTPKWMELATALLRSIIDRSSAVLFEGKLGQLVRRLCWLRSCLPSARSHHPRYLYWKPRWTGIVTTVLAGKTNWPLLASVNG